MEGYERMGRDGRGVKAASATSIEITFMYRGIRCRERLPLKPKSANLRRAEQHRAAILHVISLGVFDYAHTFPNSPRAKLFARQPGDLKTVEAYLSNWSERQKKHLKSSTLQGYRKIIDYQLIPWFGSMRLSDLRQRHVREKLDTSNATNKTLANIQSVLRKALQDAVQDELIDANPLYGWRYSKVESPKEEDEIDPFAPEEQAKILENLDGQGRNMVQFAFWSGLRTSELVALNWSDIDFVRAEVRVTKALTQAANAPETTKTRTGKRSVKLLKPALVAIEGQKAYTWLKGAEVFQNPRTHERWTGDQPIRKTLWQYALKKVGVRYRRPYQTRHTYASMMLSAGEHPMWVAKQMGHADWTMIARVYGRWMPAADISAGSKAEAKFTRNGNILPTHASASP
jgi:integrase